MINVSVDELADAIKDALYDYSEEVKEGIERVAEEIAEEAEDRLKNTQNAYTVRTGKYNASWTVTDTSKPGFANRTVNAKRPQYRLTHLLEKGHINRDGSRTRAFPHIEPVDRYVSKAFEDSVKKIIKGGNK